MNLLVQLISMFAVVTQERCMLSDPSEFYRRPQFIHSPDPVFTVQNEETIIKCRAKGAKFYLWTKSRKMTLKEALNERLKGTPLKGMPRFSVPGNEEKYPRNNGDLVIKATRLEDWGFYTCFPTNHWGSISASTRVKVRPASAPRIIWKPQIEMRVKPKQTATIKCRVLGWPRPKIKWLYRAQRGYSDKLVYGRRFKILFDGHLVVSDVRSYDAGFYRCVAVNKHGSAIAEGRLVVNGAKLATITRVGFLAESLFLLWMLIIDILSF